MLVHLVKYIAVNIAATWRGFSRTRLQKTAVEELAVTRYKISMPLGLDGVRYGCQEGEVMLCEATKPRVKAPSF